MQKSQLKRINCNKIKASKRGFYHNYFLNNSSLFGASSPLQNFLYRKHKSRTAINKETPAETKNGIKLFSNPILFMFITNKIIFGKKLKKNIRKIHSLIVLINHIEFKN